MDSAQVHGRGLGRERLREGKAERKGDRVSFPGAGLTTHPAHLSCPEPRSLCTHHLTGTGTLQGSSPVVQNLPSDMGTQV